MSLPRSLSRLPSRGRWPPGIEVWHIAIPIASTAPLADIPFLDAPERARAARYRQGADRMRFAVTRSALRRLLAHRLDADASALVFDVSGHGKPFLPAHERLSFNVSHAGSHALIAMSSTFEIGVDIETFDSAAGWRELVPLVCDASERDRLEAAPEDRRPRRFLQYWTAKEATLKALGTGIAGGLQAVSIELGADPDAAPRVRTGAPKADAVDRVACRFLDDIAPCVACLAYMTKPR